MKDLTKKLLLVAVPILVLAGTFAGATTPLKANPSGHLAAMPGVLCPTCRPGATK